MLLNWTNLSPFSAKININHVNDHDHGNFCARFLHMLNNNLWRQPFFSSLSQNFRTLFLVNILQNSARYDKILRSKQSLLHKEHYKHGWDVQNCVLRALGTKTPSGRFVTASTRHSYKHRNLCLHSWQWSQKKKRQFLVSFTINFSLKIQISSLRILKILSMLVFSRGVPLLCLEMSISCFSS